MTRPKCYDEYKKVPYQEEECNAEYVRECPKVWEVQQGAKVWVPETEKCVTLVSFEKWTLFSNHFPYNDVLNLPEKDQMQTCYQVQEWKDPKMWQWKLPKMRQSPQTKLQVRN